jgi:hypothetical protein
MGALLALPRCRICAINSLRLLLFAPRTGPAKAGPHWFKGGAFSVRDAMPHLCKYNLPAGRPAVKILGFLLCKNLKLKNGTDAIFEQRKG